MPARRPGMPPDEALPALVALHGSYLKVDAALGFPQGTLDQFLRRQSRRALRVTCEAMRRPPHTLRAEPYTTNYPDDKGLVALMREQRSLSGVARELGVRKESLRDYLRRRPALGQRMRELGGGVQRQRAAQTTPEERLKRKRARGRAYQSTVDPERKREINRRWARNQDPAKRARWNSYNRLRRAEAAPSDALAVEYMAILHGDPCGICGERPVEIDHIIPIALGGDGGWANLSAACPTCNRRKSHTPLLLWLALR